MATVDRSARRSCSTGAWCSTGCPNRVGAVRRRLRSVSVNHWALSAGGLARRLRPPRRRATPVGPRLREVGPPQASPRRSGTRVGRKEDEPDAVLLVVGELGPMGRSHPSPRRPGSPGVGVERPRAYREAGRARRGSAPPTGSRRVGGSGVAIARREGCGGSARFLRATGASTWPGRRALRTLRRRSTARCSRRFRRTSVAARLPSSALRARALSSVRVPAGAPAAVDLTAPPLVGLGAAAALWAGQDRPRLQRWTALHGAGYQAAHHGIQHDPPVACGRSPSSTAPAPTSPGACPGRHWRLSVPPPRPSSPC